MLKKKSSMSSTRKSSSSSARARVDMDYLIETLKLNQILELALRESKTENKQLKTRIQILEEEIRNININYDNDLREAKLDCLDQIRGLQQLVRERGSAESTQEQELESGEHLTFSDPI